MFGKDSDPVFDVVIPHEFHAHVPVLGEELVDDELRGAVLVDIEGEHPFAGVDPTIQQIEDGHRVGDDDLGISRLFHARDDPFDSFLMHTDAPFLKMRLFVFLDQLVQSAAQHIEDNTPHNGDGGNDKVGRCEGEL